MACLLSDLERAGGTLAVGTSVVGGRQVHSGLRSPWRLSITSVAGAAGHGSAAGAGGEAAAVFQVEARAVVNSAGLHAQEVATSLAGMPSSAVPARHLAKGNYFSLGGGGGCQRSDSPTSSASVALTSDRPSSSPGAPFSRLVYPVPEPGGLGVHYTIDMARQARFGPDVQWVDKVDYSVRLLVSFL